MARRSDDKILIPDKKKERSKKKESTKKKEENKPENQNTEKDHWIHVVGDIYAFKCGDGLLVRASGQVVFAPDVRVIKSKEHEFNEIASW